MATCETGCTWDQFVSVFFTGGTLTHDSYQFAYKAGNEAWIDTDRSGLTSGGNITNS